MKTLTTEQQPPAQAMEEAVVFALLTEPERMAEVAGRVRVEMFADPALALVYRAIQQLWKGSEPIDLLTVAQEMTLISAERTAQIGGLEYLTDRMLKAYDPGHLRAYAAWVIRNWGLRKMIAVLSRQVAQAALADADLPALLHTVEQELEEISQSVTDRSTLQRAGEAARRTVARMKDEQRRIAAGERLQIPTGIDQYDRFTGGLYRGELAVLGGRPSMGKTALALHTAMSAARQGLKTVFFSLEMTERQLMTRLLSIESGLNSRWMRLHQTSAADYARLDKAIQKIDQLPLVVCYCAGFSFEEIRAICFQLKRTAGVDLVIIDYLSLIRLPVTTGRNLLTTMDLALGDIVRRTKLMAIELDISTVMLSQLNRNCDTRADRRPQMADLRSSGEIEQEADTIALVHRDIYATDDDNPSAAAQSELLIAKNRNGETGKIHFNFRQGKVIP